MRISEVKVVGKKSFTSKKGNVLRLVCYVSNSLDNSLEGMSAGQFFLSDSDPDVKVGESYQVFVGYDRSGKFGPVGLA